MSILLFLTIISSQNSIGERVIIRENMQLTFVTRRESLLGNEILCCLRFVIVKLSKNVSSNSGMIKFLRN